MPTAGTTHDITLDNIGFLVETRSFQKFNATKPIPRFSLSQDSRAYSDFSELETWGQSSFHRGRGQLFLKDPYAFMDSSVFTQVRNMVTLPFLRTVAYKTGGSDSDFNGHVAKFFWYNNNWYALVDGTAASGNALYIWDNTNTEFDTVAAGLDTTNGVPTDAIPFGGDLFIGQGEAVVGRTYDTSAAAWQAMDVPVTYLAVWNNLLWRADNINEIYWSANPGADVPVWSGPVYIGDTNVSVTHLGVFNNRVVVGKGDAFWVLEPSGATYLPLPIADFTPINDADNLKGHASFMGAYYFNTLFGAMRYDGTSLVPVGPDRGALEEETASYQGYAQYGRLVSMQGTQNYLYACLDGGTANRSSIYAYDGFAWHYVWQTGAVNNRIRQIGYTPATTTTGVLANPRIWWSEIVGTTEYIYYIIVPEGTESPDDYTGTSYAASGNLDTSWFDYGLQGIDKNFREIEVYADKVVASAQNITVSYQKDGIDTWINPSGWTINFGPAQRLQFPEGVTCRRIRLRFALATTGSTLSPILRGYALRFLLRPAVKYGWRANVRAANNLLLLGDNGEETATGRQLSDYLWGFLDKKGPIVLDDARAMTALTNLITNPSMEVDTDANGTCDGVTSIGSPTLTHNAEWSSRGLRSQRVVTGTTGSVGMRISATVTASTQYLVSVDVYHASGDRVTVSFDDVTGGVTIADIGTVSAWTSGPRFVRVSGLYNTPAGCISARIRVERASADATQATTFYVDALMIAAASATSPYIDGDQPRCSWNSTPHASTSVRASTYTVNLVSIGESYTYRPSEGGTDETLIPIQIVEL